MLTYDPKQRISAKDALNHAFIQKNSSTAPLNEKVLNNLGTFHVKINSYFFDDLKKNTIKNSSTILIKKAKNQAPGSNLYIHCNSNFESK
jgi:hypothetical protein